MIAAEPTLPLDLPTQPSPPRATGNDVVIVDANRANGKAHRPKDQRPYLPGPRPFRPKRRGAAAAAYDGDQRRTHCGGTLGYTRHLIAAQVAATDLCRICFPGGAR